MAQHKSNNEQILSSNSWPSLQSLSNSIKTCLPNIASKDIHKGLTVENPPIKGKLPLPRKGFIKWRTCCLYKHKTIHRLNTYSGLITD